MRALAVLLLITWGAGCGAERRTLPTGAGTPDDAGGVADGGLAGDGGDEGAALGGGEGGEGGEGGDNGCGGAAYWVCTDNDGADPTCEDIDECAVGDDGDNGCGGAADWSCTNNAGADPTCRDCAGVVDGLAERDHCDVCAGGDTGVTPCVQDCQGAWGGVAATDRCGTCDADAATDCGLAISPAADAPATSWEPEMGGARAHP